MPTQTANRPKASRNSEKTKILRDPESDHQRLATRFGGTIIDSSGDNVFLLSERNRHGVTQHYIRVIIGNLPPYRYGPWLQPEQAHLAFKAATEYLEKHIDEVLWDLQNVEIEVDSRESLGQLSIEH